MRVDFLDKSKLLGDVVQHFCNSFVCLAVKDIIGEETREEVDCNQGVPALVVHQIHAQSFHRPWCWNLPFGNSGLLVALPLAISARLDNLSDVVL